MAKIPEYMKVKGFNSKKPSKLGLIPMFNLILAKLMKCHMIFDMSKFWLKIFSFLCKWIAEIDLENVECALQIQNMIKSRENAANLPWFWLLICEWEVFCKIFSFVFVPRRCRVLIGPGQRERFHVNLLCPVNNNRIGTFYHPKSRNLSLKSRI